MAGYDLRALCSDARSAGSIQSLTYGSAPQPATPRRTPFPRLRGVIRDGGFTSDGGAPRGGAPALGGEGRRVPRSGTNHRRYEGRVRSDPRAPVPQPRRPLYSVMLWCSGQPPGGESAVASDATPLTRQLQNADAAAARGQAEHL